ncbi:CRISPR associated protein of unknown function [Salmonella enterica subsp. enterica serovar Typhimurium]|nr:CRISPR associated protein of unknown function [Salmonella enterica subsp. enterica serovar Typhimurium]QDX90355.1 CRISPR associated protein of unknown function [Salmonella enterica subsp. enterica serovar Braenderup]
MNRKKSVYPRWRGEHKSQYATAIANLGLSPLARGTPPEHCQFTTTLRFIPAGAGNTQHASLRSAWRPVYPRWRGEHPASSGKMSLSVGLSPLARGTPEHKSKYNRSERFIPAGAGNTSHLQVTSPIPAVYPRWRGEHSHSAFITQTASGLSPLARGTPCIFRCSRTV